MCRVFKNYKELVRKDEIIAKELIEEKGKGKWIEEEIYFHSDRESFAEYELLDGWYSESMNLNKGFNGAPNPLFFIDLKELGTALINSWDDSCNFLSSHGEILSTSYGW